MAVQLPKICVKPFNPPARWQQLRTYILDIRDYHFMKLTDEFVAEYVKGQK